MYLYPWPCPNTCQRSRTVREMHGPQQQRPVLSQAGEPSSRSEFVLEQVCVHRLVGFLCQGELFVPVCTAAAMAGVSLLRRRTHCHWNSNQSVFHPLGPHLRGPYTFGTSDPVHPGAGLSFVANHYLLFSSLAILVFLLCKPR